MDMKKIIQWRGSLIQKVVDIPLPQGSAERTNGFVDCKEAVADIIRSHVDPVNESSADDLRECGLTLAVHNDYRLHGERHTFWLFVHEETKLSYMGEGKTDAEALNKVRTQLQELGRTGLTNEQSTRAYKAACSFGVLEGRAFQLMDAMWEAFFPKKK